METACLCLESDNHEKEGPRPSLLFIPIRTCLIVLSHHHCHRLHMCRLREHAIGVEEKTYVPMVSSTVGFSLYSNSEQFKENGRLKK